MSKSVLHYKRRIESALGCTRRWAVVHAWRSPYHDNTMRYQIECQACRTPTPLRLAGWSSPSSDFHTVMRAWTVHTSLLHPLITPPPDYPIQITSDDRAAADQYQIEYVQKIQDAILLNSIFPPGWRQTR